MTLQHPHPADTRSITIEGDLAAVLVPASRGEGVYSVLMRRDRRWGWVGVKCLVGYGIYRKTVPPESWCPRWRLAPRYVDQCLRDGECVCRHTRIARAWLEEVEGRKANTNRRSA